MTRRLGGHQAVWRGHEMAFSQPTFWALTLWETSLLIASQPGLHGALQSWIMPPSITSSVPTTNAESLEAR
jgi:hypothetical protein